MKNTSYVLVLTVFLLFIFNFLMKKDKELNGTITLVTNRIDKTDTSLKELAMEFQRINPKCHIRIEGIKNIDEEINKRKASNALGDIFVIPISWDYKDYESNLEPVDDIGFNNKNIYFYDYLKVNGKVYGLNSGINLQGIIYNKAVFREAGIKNTPKTKEEFYEVCEKIKKNGKIPLAFNYKDKWPMSVYLHDIYGVYQEPYIGHKEFVKKGIFDKDSSLLEAFDFARYLYKHDYTEKDLSNTNWESFKGLHAKGDIAMTVLGTWYIPQLIDNGLDIENIGMFPFPDSKRILVGPDYFFGISNKSKNKELAKEFLKFMLNEDRYAKAVGLITPIKKSKTTVLPIKELLDSGLPIEDILKEDEKYYAIKKEYNEDLVNTLLEYIISDEVDKFKEEKNLKWKEAQRKILDKK